MKKLIKTLLNDKRGVAFLEFALAVPLLILLFVGAVEIARYVIILQKAERSAYVISNITDQYTPITFSDKPSEIDPDALKNQIFTQLKINMEPYGDDKNVIAIITSLSKITNGAGNGSLNINWQAAGGGQLGIATDTKITSIINGLDAASVNNGAPNGTAAGTKPTFPSSKRPLMDGALASMRNGENMLIVEVFHNYTPILSSVVKNLGMGSLSQQVISSTTYSRPRYGNLITLVRPAEPEPAPVIDVTCNTTASPTTTCKTYDSAIDCRTYTACTTCTDREVCTTCTTPFMQPKSCVTNSDRNINCTVTRTYVPIVGCVPADDTMPPTPAG